MKGGGDMVGSEAGGRGALVEGSVNNLDKEARNLPVLFPGDLI
jgi:hypothetical protein